MNIKQALTIFTNSVFILYLLISANVLLPLFGCHIQKIFLQTMWIKHVLAFFTLYFFVTLTNPYLNSDPVLALKLNVLIYILFMLSAQLKWKLWVIVFICMIVNYIFTIFKPVINTEYIDTIENIQFVFNIVVISVILFGFIYAFKFNELSFKNFILGSPTCNL